MANAPSTPAAASRPRGARLSSSQPRHASPSFLSALGQRSGKLVVMLGVVLIVIVAVLDYLTPSDLRFFIFYWPAIAMVSWYVGRKWGFFAVALSTVGSTLANGADWAAVRTYVLWWNASVNVLSFVMLAYLTSQLRALVDWEREVARTDFVTGLPNTRAFYEGLGVELSRSRRTRTPVTLAYLDIDDFKQVNDRCGHDAGDTALREIAQTIRGTLRNPDLLARLGGDEFVILLPATGRAEAQVVLGRVQAKLHEGGVAERWQTTFSLGAVTSANGTCDADDLIHGADDLMYEVKQGGKNASRFAVLDEGTGPDPGQA